MPSSVVCITAARALERYSQLGINAVGFGGGSCLAINDFQVFGDALDTLGIYTIEHV
jgi:hypothetical protein